MRPRGRPGGMKDLRGHTRGEGRAPLRSWDQGGCGHTRGGPRGEAGTTGGPEARSGPGTGAYRRIPDSERLQWILDPTEGAVHGAGSRERWRGSGPSPLGPNAPPTGSHLPGDPLVPRAGGSQVMGLDPHGVGTHGSIGDWGPTPPPSFEGAGSSDHVVIWMGLPGGSRSPRGWVIEWDGGLSSPLP